MKNLIIEQLLKCALTIILITIGYSVRYFGNDMLSILLSFMAVLISEFIFGVFKSRINK